MFIDRVDVENLRCFRKTSVSFLHPDREGTRPALPNITLLLGDNGAGKSSLLRAVALTALASVIQSSGFVPFSMVRRERQKPFKSSQLSGAFFLHAQDGDGKKAPTPTVTTHVEVRRRGTTELIEVADKQEAFFERMYDDGSPAFLVVGYGATRRIEASDSVDLAARQKQRLLRYQRVAGLFEEQVTMIPLNAWLPKLSRENRGRHKQVVNLLDQLLPEGTSFKGQLEGNQYVFEHRGVATPFGAMSDGYRQYAGWISDLLYHVCMGAPSGKKLIENRGIVMIDEIDLHLHPEWQRTVIPTLAKTLPNLQFILTSHSPILVGTLYRENVVVFDQDNTEASIAAPVQREVHGLNADQVLTSPAFGLSSSRAPGFVSELKKISTRAQAGDLQAQRRFHKMIVYGAAADQVQMPFEEPPDDVVQAARRLKATDERAVQAQNAVAPLSSTPSSGGLSTPPKKAATGSRTNGRSKTRKTRPKSGNKK